MDELVVVGSGDAFNAAGRRHSCYLLEGEGFGPLMIDFGATALLGLRKLGREPSGIAGFAFTHMHGDHGGGWPFLLIDGMFNDPRSALLDVVGPRGATERLAAFMRVAYGDIEKYDKPFDLRVRELDAGSSVEHVGVTIEGFAAEHMSPPNYAMCLRLTLPSGKVVAFSGDTAMCDGLFAAADGADLLIAECSCPAPPCGKHCTWQEWQEAFDKMNAKRIVLTHLGAAMRALSAELVGSAALPAHVSFADDGLTLRI